MPPSRVSVGRMGQVQGNSHGARAQVGAQWGSPARATGPAPFAPCHTPTRFRAVHQSRQSKRGRAVCAECGAAGGGGQVKAAQCERAGAHTGTPCPVTVSAPTCQVGGMLVGDDNKLYGATFPGSPLDAARCVYVCVWGGVGRAGGDGAS